MNYFHSSFYYVRYRMLLKCWKQVLSGNHFTFKLFLFALVFTVVFFLHQLLNLLFRAIDEIIFPAYRSVKISQPVFIIANPRSGTTFLHHLLSNDERYAYINLAQTIFPSVSFIKLYQLIGFIDRKIGSPVLKILKRLDYVLYGGWKNIHPLTFNKTEEDEAPYTLSLTSPAVFLLFPFLHLAKENWLLDLEPENVKQGMMNYYENCVKRFMYANGKDKIYLSKNVLSSGRINSLMARFPDAKVIYVARNPFEALPSFISMFAAMYHMHSPHIKKTDAAMQAWAWLAIAFYRHMHEAMKKIDRDNLCVIKYDQLIKEPQATVEFIYKQLNINLSDKFKLKLDAGALQNKTYQSRHSYSLEEYGLSKHEIYKELKFIFDQFEFNQ